MSNTFLLLGILIWLVSTSYKFYVWSKSTISWKTIWKSITISLKSSGVDLTFSLLQIIGEIWIIVGVILIIVGEDLIKGFYGSLIVAALFIIPIWTAAAIIERKNRTK